MKSILLAFLFFTSIISHSQTSTNVKIYLDSLENETTEANHRYYRIIKDYLTPKETYVFYDYYKSGVLRMIGSSKSRESLIPEGPFIYYFENGKKRKIVNYKNAKPIGKEYNWYENESTKSEIEYLETVKEGTSNFKINQFWDSKNNHTVVDGNGFYEDTNDNLYEKGEIKKGEKQGVWEGKYLKKKINFTENYNEGVFISGISTDENNNQFPYKEIMEKPFPAKGMPDFYKHIGRNYNTPKVEGLKGKIYISFVVDEDGKPTNFKILRDIGYGSGLEGIKAIASYGKWIPGKMRGIPAKVMYSLPIAIQSSNNSFQPNYNPFPRGNDPNQTNNNSFR